MNILGRCVAVAVQAKDHASLHITAHNMQKNKTVVWNSYQYRKSAYHGMLRQVIETSHSISSLRFTIIMLRWSTKQIPAGARVVRRVHQIECVCFWGRD